MTNQTTDNWRLPKAINQETAGSSWQKQIFVKAIIVGSITWDIEHRF